MGLKRRRLLVAGGGVWRACDQGVFEVGQGPAYEAWTTWQVGTGALAAVRAAILAASPHNIQPWLFRVRDSQVDLLADQRRSLGAIDPLQREKEIGLGCALENLVLAAEAHGYKATVMLLPSETDSTHVARIDLLPAKPTTSPLYQAIPHRHTNRYAYDRRRTVSQSDRCSHQDTPQVSFMPSPLLSSDASLHLPTSIQLWRDPIADQLTSCNTTSYTDDSNLSLSI
jgi:hypothetical protein